MKDTVDARRALKVNGKEYQLWSLESLGKDRVARLPYSLRILLENLLRHEDGINVTRKDIDALLDWDPKAEPDTEIAFTPARVILQDFTGVPAVVDLAAMRDAVVKLGGRAEVINPLSPAELVIDHSVQVDSFGAPDSLKRNNAIEFERNQERYSFLRWGQDAFDNFKVVPPNTGIVHQVNLEFLGRVVFDLEKDGKLLAYPDTLVGTDSHTTMINGLGVLGWGVGGIEAEAAMLGQPVTMLIPQVIGFRLKGSLAEGATATDLVLTVTEMLRKKGVVGKFVEFFGDGLSNLPLADRATLGNMSPEFGSTCAIFPIDAETVRYLKLSGRSDERIALVEAYAKAQGLWREDGQPEAQYTDILELDMGNVKPSLAGPKRPQDRVLLSDAKASFLKHLAPIQAERVAKADAAVARFEAKAATSVGNPASAAASGLGKVARDGGEFVVRDGAVLIAAITSCTNTSNPAVMLAAGLVARNAAARGMKVKPWVKTSLAPGSKVVTEYLKKAGLLDDLEALGFNVVGYGCTTCIGNSGPLPEDIASRRHTTRHRRDQRTVRQPQLRGPHPPAGAHELPGFAAAGGGLCAGRQPRRRRQQRAAGRGQGRQARLPQGYLAELPRSPRHHHGRPGLDHVPDSYGGVFRGDANWQGLSVPEGSIYEWPEESTYVRNPPYFEGMGMQPEAVKPISGARVLAVLGDSVTTDHISPAGSIASNSPAAKYLVGKGVDPNDFNSYGSRRGNHEVMMRGTFANIRLRNKLAGGVEGGWTKYLPTGEVMAIYDAAMRYKDDGTPLVILAGKEYGSGSSRDWAAKGTKLLGVEAVIAESYERIHRSNLIGMGVVPLQFRDGENATSLGLDGTETFTIEGLGDGSAREVTVTAAREGAAPVVFKARVRIDTPKEREYYQHGGILHYVLRQLAGADQAA
jgi:aconitate hydratase